MEDITHGAVLWEISSTATGRVLDKPCTHRACPPRSRSSTERALYTERNVSSSDIRFCKGRGDPRHFCDITEFMRSNH